ncbi:MAG: putative LPS assembly protein LptD [Bacteroidia bacterium]
MQRWQILCIWGFLWAQDGSFRDTIYYQAEDSIVFRVTGERIELYNQVELRAAGSQVRAGYVVVDWKEGTLRAYGIDSQGKLLQAPVAQAYGETYYTDSLRYFLGARYLQAYQIKVQHPDEIIYGMAVQRDPVGDVYILRGKYTTCTHNPPHFYFDVSRMKIVEGKQVISGPVYMVVEEVPLPLGLPFAFLPISDKRSSGFILPALGNAGDRGVFLRGMGYYWSISRYMDLLFTGDYFTRGGYRVETQWNYRKRYWYQGRLSLQYALQAFNEPGDPDYTATRTYFVTWRHQQTLSPTSSLTANVQGGSSTFLQRQSYNTTDYLRTNLQSSIAYQKIFWGTPWTLSVAATHDQNLIQKTLSITAPVIALYQNRIFPFARKNRIGLPRWYEKIGYTYRLDAQAQVSLPESLWGQRVWDTLQWGVRQAVQVGANYTAWGVLTFAPSLNYQEYTYPRQIAYQLDSLAVRPRRLNKPISVRDFNATLSLSTRLYGRIQFRSARMRAFRHTVIPVLGYAFHPDFGNPGWGAYVRIADKVYPRAEGLYGKPPPGKVSALQFSLSNLFEMKALARGDTTRRKFIYTTLVDNISLSTSYNFAADSFRLAPVALNARTNFLQNKLNVNFNATLDPYTFDSLGRRYKTFRYDAESKLATLTNFNLALGTQLRSRLGATIPESLATQYVAFDVPWSVSVQYNLVGLRNFHPDYVRKYRLTQTLNFSVELNLTSKWRLQVTSGYDFVGKKLSFTSVNIYRDMHCWEMSFNWIPFGARQSYFLTISARGTRLQDLRLTKRRDWQDRFTGF